MGLQDLGRSVFVGLFVELFVLIASLLLRDDKRKVAVVLVFGTLFAGAIGFSEEIVKILIEFTSPSARSAPPASGAVVTLATAQIGAIKWELEEYSTGEVLAMGNSSIFKKDVHIEKRIANDGTTFYSERIPLTANFSVGLSNFPETNKPRGFGFWLQRIDLDTFSWEWFDIRDNQVADKLQGGGQLSYAAGLVNSKWEITRTKFLTDIVLRSYSRAEPFDVSKPTWIVTIFKESYIDWPDHD